MRQIVKNPCLWDLWDKELAFGGGWWATKLKVTWKKSKLGIGNSRECCSFKQGGKRKISLGRRHF